jgi:hypothetical protein
VRTSAYIEEVRALAAPLTKVDPMNPLRRSV